MIPIIRILIVDSTHTAYVVAHNSYEQKFLSHPATITTIFSEVVKQDASIKHIEAVSETIFNFLYSNESVTLIKIR